MDMKNKSGYVAVIDLGSSKLVGVIAQKTSNQEVKIIASMVDSTDNCIRRGGIYNVNDAKAKINKIIRGLEEKSRLTIEKIYVNLNGRSLRSEIMIPERTFEEGESITENDLESIREQINENVVPEYEIIKNTIPQYYVDDQPVANPVGVVGQTLYAPYLSIIALPSLKMNIMKSLPAIEKVEFIVGPLATAQVVLTENEKQSGVAMIDFGGGCTSLVIYKNGLLKHLAVIPFGGDNITKDLCTLNFNQDTAERLKCRIGCLNLDAESTKKISTGNGEEVLETKISQVIKARQREILKNVLKQLSPEELEKDLASGIVITGGASKIPGLLEFIRSVIPQRIKSTSINIKQAVPFYPKGVRDEFKAPEFAALHGLMYQAYPDSIKIISEPQEKVASEENVEESKSEPRNEARSQNKKPQKRSIWEKWGRVRDLFDEKEDEDEDDFR